MSKDEAIGKLVRLAEQCDEPSIRRLCDEVEETLEIGPYGVCTWADPRLNEPRARANELEIDSPVEPAVDPVAWEVVAACSTG